MKKKELVNILTEVYYKGIEWASRGVDGDALIVALLSQVHIKAIENGFKDNLNDDVSNLTKEWYELAEALSDDLDDEDIEIFTDWGFISIRSRI